MKYYRIMRGILFGIYNRVKKYLGMMKRRVPAPSLPINEDNKVYVHLWCGEINAPGFINVDAIPFSHIHYVQDVEDLSIFPNKYTDLNWASRPIKIKGKKYPISLNIEKI